VEYLGLKENIRVRRAGFAFRREFPKFLRRYCILTPETYPRWSGTVTEGIKHLMQAVNMEPDQWQLGKTKVFVKSPESLFLLEELRERKYDGFARKIQKAWRRYKSDQYFFKLKQKASDILLNKKERKRLSINRNFVGDYLGITENPSLRALVGKRERIDFSQTVTKYDRRFKTQKRDLLLSPSHVYLIGREKIKKGPMKGQFVEVIKRKIPLDHVGGASLSPFQDDFVVLHVANEYDTVIETPLKTEFLTLLSEKYKALTQGTLQVSFNRRLTFTVKKEGFGGGGTRQLQFNNTGQGDASLVRPSGKTLNVTVGPGLPPSTKPSHERPSQSKGGRGGRGGRSPARAAPQGRHTANQPSYKQPSRGGGGGGGGESSSLVSSTLSSSIPRDGIGQTRSSVPSLQYSRICLCRYHCLARGESRGSDHMWQFVCYGCPLIAHHFV
jgi:myosin-1